MLPASCKDANSGVSVPIFTTSSDLLKFTSSGGSSLLKVTMNGSSWSASSDQSWCAISSSSSTKTNTQVTVIAEASADTKVRTAKLTFVMDQKTTIYVNVSQAAKVELYPSYKDSIAPDVTGMSSTAIELAKKMKLGLNIGNTLEATGGEDRKSVV